MGHLTRSTSGSLIAGLLVFCAPAAVADEVGLIAGTFAATYIPASPGCTSLLVTGQFMAPSAGYVVNLEEASPQDNVMIFKLLAKPVPPTDPAAQVLTPTPVQYAKPDYTGCHYGVSIAYGDQTIVVGLMPAVIEER